MHTFGRSLTNYMVILPSFHSYDWHGSLCLSLSVFHHFFKKHSHDSHVAEALFVDAACVFV